MTPRERKYHLVKSLNRKGISVRTFAYKRPEKPFSLSDLEGHFCMCIPNYCYDREGKIIPPKDGSKPTDTFTFGKWEDGKMVDTDVIKYEAFEMVRPIQPITTGLDK